MMKLVKVKIKGKIKAQVREYAKKESAHRLSIKHLSMIAQEENIKMWELIKKSYPEIDISKYELNWGTMELTPSNKF